jgi:hypothetical protein
MKSLSLKQISLFRAIFIPLKLPGPKLSIFLERFTHQLDKHFTFAGDFCESSKIGI